MGQWLYRNRYLVLGIAGLLAIALLSAVDSCRARASLRKAEDGIKARNQIIQEIREERDELQRRLDSILKRKKKAWKIPEDLNETVTRYNALGY